MGKGRQFHGQEGHRVAVSLGVGSLHQADGASAAGAVEDNDGLAQMLFCCLGQRPGCNIGTASRGIRHDQRDGLIRKSGAAGFIRSRRSPAGNR
ncbi:hypothetical protein D3C87_1856690 [compost metagenome]